MTCMTILIQSLDFGLNIDNMLTVPNMGVGGHILSPKFSTYSLRLNQELRVSNTYLEHLVVPEYHRITFTRLRLSSIYLKNETGRWKIPPLPVNERYCQCGFANQNEIHIIQDCVISQHIRDLNPDIDFDTSRFFNHDDPYTVCKLSYEIYQLYI